MTKRHKGVKHEASGIKKSLLIINAIQNQARTEATFPIRGRNVAQSRQKPSKRIPVKFKCKQNRHFRDIL